MKYLAAVNRRYATRWSAEGKFIKRRVDARQRPLEAALTRTFSSDSSHSLSRVYPFGESFSGALGAGDDWLSRRVDVIGGASSGGEDVPQVTFVAESGKEDGLGTSNEGTESRERQSVSTGNISALKCGWGHSVYVMDDK